MTIIKNLQETAALSLTALYEELFTENDFQVNKTKPEFEGDYTIVLFSLVKRIKRSPEVLGNELGEHILKNNPTLFSGYNVIKGFLNLTFTDTFLIGFLDKNYHDESFGKKQLNGKKVMVEYSSPNTNKPIHLGHLRNNFLGWSVAAILKANGNEVIKSAVVNDRGIHICKSMIAWQLFGNGQTPGSANMKGDHFVGKYYVKFNDEYKRQVEVLIQEGVEKEKAEKQAPIMVATQQMLIDWENHKPDVIELWNKMNGWVYKGFDITYKRIGSDFDKTYYESNTYLLGKRIVDEGLAKGVFTKEEDGSIWIDLTNDGLDKKIVQRKDGTSVYITQDIGLAQNKYEEYKIDKSFYVIGDEQNYHMKVLKLIAEKLGLPNARNIYHLSYGMVELPSGRMKSREGNVVDADDLLDEMEATAKQHTEDLGKVKDFTPGELEDLYKTISMGAVKFYLLRVDPKKKMVFDPEESIDFHGFTGPFVQYTYARIKSVLRKVEGGLMVSSDGVKMKDNITGNEQEAMGNEQEAMGNGQDAMGNEQEAMGNEQEAMGNEQEAMGNEQEAMGNGQEATGQLFPLEKELIFSLEQYPTILEQAADELNPSVLANYVFHLAKTFNSFYTEHSIANAEDEQKKELRIHIAAMTANVIKSSMKLLGIEVPERM